MFMSEWCEFPSAPCLAGKKKNLMTARVSMLLKSRASLTCFRACFLPGRAGDLSAPGIPCLSVIRRIRFVADTETFGNELTLYAEGANFVFPLVPKHGDSQRIIKDGSKLQRWMS